MNSGANPILVVDDDADIRESLSDLLRDEGYSVATAADGEDALAFMRAGPLPCVVLLDLMMPVVDGCEFRKQQSADPALAPVPVVVITASGKSAEIVERLRVHACLPKPFDIDRLMAVILEFAHPPVVGPQEPSSSSSPLSPREATGAANGRQEDEGWEAAS